MSHAIFANRMGKFSYDKHIELKIVSIYCSDIFHYKPDYARAPSGEIVKTQSKKALYIRHGPTMANKFFKHTVEMYSSVLLPQRDLNP